MTRGDCKDFLLLYWEGNKLIETHHLDCLWRVVGRRHCYGKFGTGGRFALLSSLVAIPTWARGPFPSKSPDNKTSVIRYVNAQVLCELVTESVF
jgi:hypothetical protein